MACEYAYLGCSSCASCGCCPEAGSLTVEVGVWAQMPRDHHVHEQVPDRQAEQKVLSVCGLDRLLLR